MLREQFTTVRIPYRGYGVILGRTIEKFPTYLVRFDDGDSRWLEDSQVCDDERDDAPIYHMEKVRDVADNIVLWEIISHENKAGLRLVK